MNSIVISTERLNSKGFRIISDGGDISDYLKNPVLLYDHTRRTTENSKDIILPIGRINNLRLVNKAWIGDPEFDMDDSFARAIANKFQKGYINASSPGIEIVEVSAEPNLMVPGQALPTVTKWKLREVSITDIPANADAVKLSCNGKEIVCNAKNNLVELSHFFNGMPGADMSPIGQLKSEWDRRWRDGSLTDLRATNPAYYNKLYQARFKGAAAQPDRAAIAQPKASTSTESRVELAAQFDRMFRDGSLEDLRKSDPTGYERLFNARYRRGKSKLELKAEYNQRVANGTLDSLRIADPDWYEILCRVR